MAVYTRVSAELLAEFVRGYDIGTPISFKGIAEGVENSNYFLETTTGRYFLTLYEKRVVEDELPYFIALMTHLADKGLPVPRPISDRRGVVLQRLAGRPACLIEFLAGVSVSEPEPEACHAAGDALGRMHAALADFPLERPNALGPAAWRELGASCLARADQLPGGIGPLIASELAEIANHWPERLPRATIHADLFPDNLMFSGPAVSALIDFYFACTEIRAYDLAVMHGSWCFDADGNGYHADRAAALIAGYRSAHPLLADEVAAFGWLCRGAALRFLLTRAVDWLDTPPNALVTRKDPLAFARRLEWYRAAGETLIA